MKKYKVIAKVDTEKFVKYNVNNLLLFTKFLDSNFINWRYFNVYEWTKDDTGSQICSYSRHKRPLSRYV